ncbi:unknown protein (plasmid) [Calothrix sp. PCC 7716]|nr:unknown protein [Calothrix sp. PCC 7716]
MSNFIEIVDKVKEMTGSNLTYAQFAAVFKDAMLNSTLSKERQEQLKEESKSLSNDKKEDILKGIGNYIIAKENELNIPYNNSNNQIIQSNETSIKDESSITNISTKNNSNAFEQNHKPTAIADNKTPLIEEDKKIDLPSPSDNEVKQYVIPVVADKIASYGKSDINKDSITYENENFTAMLRLGDEEQRITLDRKNMSPDTANALTASKSSKEQEYQIILNNLTRDEFERFKALFEKANQEKNNTNKDQHKSDELG